MLVPGFRCTQYMNRAMQQLLPMLDLNTVTEGDSANPDGSFEALFCRYRVLVFKEVTTKFWSKLLARTANTSWLVRAWHHSDPQLACPHTVPRAGPR